jgi:hypothetical protein
VNHLVRKRLAEMEALNSQSQNNRLLEEGSDEEDDNPFRDKGGSRSSDSESSDPLGMMASVMDDGEAADSDAIFGDSSEGGTTPPPGRDRRASSKQRASVRTAKFSKLNVLASIEGPPFSSLFFSPSVSQMTSIAPSPIQISCQSSTAPDSAAAFPSSRTFYNPCPALPSPADLCATESSGSDCR